MISDVFGDNTKNVKKRNRVHMQATTHLVAPRFEINNGFQTLRN